MWLRLDDPQTNSVLFETISALVELFQRVPADERRAIASGLGRSAKYAMAEYSREKAVEGRQVCSSSVILQGLISVVMASAAQFATDDAVAEWVSGFPLLPLAERDIARFGVQERKTPTGVVYEGVVESQLRGGWWSKLIKRRRVNREDALAVLRRIEKEYESPKT